MAKKNSEAEKVLKVLYKQMSGKLTKDDTPVPPAIIKGEGEIYAVDPFNKNMVRVERGSIIYVLEENYDSQGRTLIYCKTSDIICIDPDEIEEIGFN
jgi:hypothetical protein|tara:strand:+ start:152 stop:442 length:291 start_codon:yes stop_codon:yes gene_type:complete